MRHNMTRHPRTVPNDLKTCTRTLHCGWSRRFLKTKNKNHQFEILIPTREDQTNYTGHNLGLKSIGVST